MDISEIAGKLTEAQRMWLTGRGAGTKCTIRLMEKGLIKRYYPGFELTPLGLAVKAHLTNTEGER